MSTVSTSTRTTTTSLPPAPPPKRADARRNYERLLATAREVFAEEGADASLEEIARRAGVGIGTLYRHFPTRQALLEAVFQDEFEALRAEAAALLAAPDPGEALAGWLRAQLAHAAAYRGLSGSVMIAMLDEGTELSAALRAMHEAGADLLSHAQRAGAVRPDLDVSTLLKLVCAVGVATEQAPNAAEQGERLLGIVLDGLRVQPPAGR
jgi:AcrR family transcriptional regulator